MKNPHEDFMKAAYALAEMGRGHVSPNPLVGAIIVKSDEIIGQGFHERYGTPHAEINALSNCSKSPAGATLYVTLEPCCHFGKTPPCTEAIIKSGIKEVYISLLDPNPLVCGKGLAALKQAGITTHVGLMADLGRIQNEVFFHSILTSTPFVTLKYAMTMDGKTTTASGESKWITNEKSRENVHRSRFHFSAVMVGVGTVIADNPRLTCHGKFAKDPTRIICDTNLRTPLDSILVTSAQNTVTIIATCCHDVERHLPYLENGCKILVIPLKGSSVDLKQLMSELYKLNIDSVFIEGGSELSFSALKSQIVHKVQTYIAPVLIGGVLGKSPVGGLGFQKLSDGISLRNSTIKYFDEDILIESEVNYTCSQV